MFVLKLSLTVHVHMKTDVEPHLLKSRQVGKCRSHRICFVTGNLRPDLSGYSGIPRASHLRHARQSLNSGGCYRFSSERANKGGIVIILPDCCSFVIEFY